MPFFLNCSRTKSPLNLVPDDFRKSVAKASVGQLPHRRWGGVRSVRANRNGRTAKCENMRQANALLDELETSE